MMWISLKAKTISIFIVFYSLIAFVQLFAQNNGHWKILNEGMKGRLNSVDFISDIAGWIAVSDGLLMKTEDGGLTWNPISVSDELNITQIDFINETTGWAIGRDRDIGTHAIFNTENAGPDWILQYQQNDQPFKNLQVVNDSTVCVHGSNMIVKTVNGGKDWVDISPDTISIDIYSVRFMDPERGIIGGSVDEDGPRRGFIFKTFNGGSDWELNIHPELNNIDDFQFIDDSLGYFLAYSWEAETEYSLCRTKDMGETWEKVYTSHYRINSYFLMDNELLYISVYDSLDQLNLLKSKDQGANWENIFSISNWEIPFIKLNDEDMGLIICQLSGRRSPPNNLFLTNRFDNKNWLTQRFQYSLGDVLFLDQNRGYSVGGYSMRHGPSGGDIFFTADGGITWSPYSAIPGRIIYKCDFISDSTGFLITNESSISKTTDSGKTWRVVYEDNFDSTGFTFQGNDIQADPENTIWVTGISPHNGQRAIINSKDEGKTWNLFWTYQDIEETSYTLNSIHIIDDIVWSVGENGFIVRIVDMDSFKIVDSPTDMPLMKVFFSDIYHGWIAGGYNNSENFQPLLLKTNNGGDTWIEQENFPYIINEIFFHDSLRGTAVGYDQNEEGLIIATNDGGKSWFLQVDQLLAPLTAIHFEGDYGWAVGGNGLILRTEDGTNWIDQNTDKAYPDKFSLSQNYPNPFNPSTIISFTLPKDEIVKIDLYNTLGQKIKTILNNNMNTGNHKIEFKAQKMASGIYYYHIEAGEFQDVKKMILLR